MKLHTIIPGKLYQRGRTNHLSMADKRATLRAARICLTINVAPRTDEDLAHLLGNRYIHWPFADNHVPAVDALALYTTRIVTQLRREGAALVTCNAGRNRSSLLTALVVMEMWGLSGTEAVAHVRRCRPNALANEQFVRFLEERFR